MAWWTGACRYATAARPTHIHVAQFLSRQIGSSVRGNRSNLFPANGRLMNYGLVDGSVPIRDCRATNAHSRGTISFSSDRIIRSREPVKPLPSEWQTDELWLGGRERADTRLPRDQRTFTWHNFFLVRSDHPFAGTGQTSSQRMAD